MKQRVRENERTIEKLKQKVENIRKSIDTWALNVNNNKKTNRKVKIVRKKIAETKANSKLKNITQLEKFLNFHSFPASFYLFSGFVFGDVFHSLFCSLLAHSLAGEKIPFFDSLLAKVSNTKIHKLLSVKESESRVVRCCTQVQCAHICAHVRYSNVCTINNTRQYGKIVIYHLTI